MMFLDASWCLILSHCLYLSLSLSVCLLVSVSISISIYLYFFLSLSIMMHIHHSLSVLPIVLLLLILQLWMHLTHFWNNLSELLFPVHIMLSSLSSLCYSWFFSNPWYSLLQLCLCYLLILNYLCTYFFLVL